MRKSDCFLIFVAVFVILLGAMFVHSSYGIRKEIASRKERGEMVKRFDLTDLCLFTEASYTRHLTQADLHTPFQDNPGSLEHFPSGSIVGPPARLLKNTPLRR